MTAKNRTNERNVSKNALRSWEYVSEACGVKNMRVLKMFCKYCHAPAVIQKSDPQIEQGRPRGGEVIRIYCRCTDIECGHTFVSEVTFKHTLSPSTKTSDDMMRVLVGAIGALRPDQRQFALDLLQAE